MDYISTTRARIFVVTVHIKNMIKSGLTEDEYYALLKDKYAEDDNYVPKVKGIAEEVKMCINILEYQKK